MRSFLFLFLALLSLSFPVAAAENYAIDTPHTQIIFTVDHLGFSTLHGQFKAFEGALVLDHTEPENSSVSFTIQSNSIDTAWPDRDTHLRGADFLNVEQYPTIQFVSTKVDVKGQDKAQVHGNLTLHGVTKPIILEVTLRKMGPHPFQPEKTVAGFIARATLKRSDFGMGYGLPLIGDEIGVTINLEASPVQPAAVSPGS